MGTLTVWGPEACITHIREFLEEFLFGDGVYIPWLGIEQSYIH